MTPPLSEPMPPSTPAPPAAALTARSQEMEMFGHLFSTFSSTAANQPAAMKRQRAEQGTLDSAMPQAAPASNSSQATTQPSSKRQRQGQEQEQAITQGQGQEQESHFRECTHRAEFGGRPVGDEHVGRASKLEFLSDSPAVERPVDAGGEDCSSPRASAPHTEQDTRLYLFLKPNQEYSVLPLMLQLATEWRATMEQTPEKLTMSLREVMIRGLLKEWRARLQAFQSNEEARGTAQRLQWLDSLGHWNHMRWCPTKQDLVLTEKTESQSTEEILKQIGELEDMISGDSIRTFKSLKHLRESYQTEWVQFLVEIQLRGPGDRLWTIFNGLIGSAALHLLAARLRRDRYPLSGLAQSIQTQLW